MYAQPFARTCSGLAFSRRRTDACFWSHSVVPLTFPGSIVHTSGAREGGWGAGTVGVDRTVATACAVRAAVSSAADGGSGG